MGKVFFRVLVIGVVFFSFPFLAESRQYKIATIPWAGWSPLQVAAAKGFWKDLGVDVTIEYYSDGSTMHDAIFTGQVDFAMNMVGTTVDWYFQIKPVTILAETNWSHGGDKILIKKGETFEELKNKPIGVYMKGVALTYFLEQYLNTRNLTVADYPLVKILPKHLVDQFIVGRLSSIIIFDPLALRAEVQGDGVVVATSADFERSIPECIYTFSNYLEEIPESDVVKILGGWIKAVHWISMESNRKEYYEILNAQTFKDEPDFSDSELDQMVAAVRIHDERALCQANRKNGDVKLYLDKVNEMIAAKKIEGKGIEVDTIFDNHYIMKALELYAEPCDE